MIDAIITSNIAALVKTLNDSKVKKEDIITIFQNEKGKYVAVYYLDLGNGR